MAESAWFHRELPLAADRVEKDNPRLSSARALVASGAVRPEAGQWRVGEGSSTHWVELGDDNSRCSCRWFARYRATRGPCAHILAASIAAAAR